MVGVTLFTAEVRVYRPLKSILEIPRDVRNISTTDAAVEVQRTASAFVALTQEITTREAELKLASQQKRQLETTLAETETLHAMMLERANDGSWDQDLNTGKIDFSPRWLGMFGFTNSDGPMDADTWKGLIHPDDNEAVLMRLQNHITGVTPHFDAEYRMRRSDGQYRWIHSRGKAIRHASGKSYRMISMDSDIHERKALEDTIVRAAEGLSALSGQEFFHRLMLNLASVLGTRDNLVCYCVDDPPTRAHTLAYYSKGQFAEENFEYELAGTSCGAVIDREEIVYCPTGVCDIWPFEKQYDRDSYLGVPMFDSNGKIIGHFACMDGKPMRQDLPRLELFKIFAVRAAAELERLLLTRQIVVQKKHSTPQATGS